MRLNHCALLAALLSLSAASAPAPAAMPTIHNLGTFGALSSGYAVNDAGQVAGYSYLTGNTATHAFRYDGTPGSGGVMRDLSSLGGTYCWGFAVNAAGQVAGSGNIIGDSAFHAFLYTGTPGAGGQMIDLDVWLDANNPAEGAKWTLTEAYGVSNTGWVTGTGAYDPDGPGRLSDGYRAFLLDARSLLPEPSADFNNDYSIDGADIRSTAPTC